MTDITLTAGVRQNLLSLQATADLLTTTQNRLATGKKVNTAFDNPTSFFASQSLSNRASDLSTLLDQIGQAQQTLNAANQGLTSLTSLLQSALSGASYTLAIAATDTAASIITNFNAISGLGSTGAITANTDSTGHLQLAANPLSTFTV